jgi:hypothetical protein
MAATLEDARRTADQVLDSAKDHLVGVVEQANEQIPGLDLPVPKKKKRWGRLLVLVLVGVGLFVVVKQMTKSSAAPPPPSTVDDH